MKGRLYPKRLLLGILVFILLYLLWLSGLLLRFKPFRAEKEWRQGPPYEVEGVYHIHTTFSDGNTTPEKIARIAARQSLDFIILTDHGKPNLPSLASQGWKDGVLVLAGSELSVSRGHLVALGFLPPSQPFPQNADLALREIRVNGGFGVIAHPYSKIQWSWGETAEISGLEIIDSDTMFKRNFFSALPYLPTFLLKPSFYVLKILERPEQTLKKWDELGGEQPVYGYFSADAHLFYGALLGCFHLHALLDTPLDQDFEAARAQVFDALRRGRFYNAVDAAGSASGFRFWAKGSRAKLITGSVIGLNPESPIWLRARVPAPSALEIRLVRDGVTVMKTTKHTLAFLAAQPGTYRVEVYLTGWSPLSKNIPWIVSNPIFLRKDDQ